MGKKLKKKKAAISDVKIKNAASDWKLKELGKLRKDGLISTNAVDFEKLVKLMMVIGGKIKFDGKFRILLEHDPERMVTTFKFFDC